MLSKDLIKQIKNIQLKAGYLATDALSGEYLSAFKGTGIEFEKVREYIPGDEIRSIDWNVTARMNAPYVKVFHEERELTLMLAIDVSPSQQFGTQGRFKNEAAAELGAVLAYLAIKNNDKVGMVLFSDHVEAYIPPNKGRSHVWQMIKMVLSHTPQGHGTDLDEVCRFLSRVIKRKSSCFMVSDFIDVGQPRSFVHLAKKHDLTCIRTQDPMEVELKDIGLVSFVDAESGAHFVAHTGNVQLKKGYHADQKRDAERQNDFWKKLGVASFDVSSEASVVDPLIRYIRQRERKR